MDLIVFKWPFPLNTVFALFQLSIADDACQPPAALQGKLKEVEKLIQTESSESGRVSFPCSSLTHLLYKELYVNIENNVRL